MYRPLEGSEELLDTNTERPGWILMEDTLEGGEKVEVNLRAHLCALRLIPHDQFCQLLKVWSFFLHKYTHLGRFLHQITGVLGVKASEWVLLAPAGV